MHNYFIVCGIHFTIDHTRHQLFETSRPYNVIPFDELCPDGNSLLLAFDTIEGTLYTGDLEPLPDYVEFVSIPDSLILYSNSLF
jgi:hypothetical protein